MRQGRRDWAVFPGRRRACAAVLVLLWAATLLGASPGIGPVQRLRPVPRAMAGLPGSLEIDLSTGVPVVEAMIGEEPLRLVVDTGANFSMLTPGAAERLGLVTHEPEDLKAGDAAGEQRAVKAAHIQRLDLPTGGGKPVSFGDFDVVVMESVIAAHAKVDGVLGLPMLRRTVARFDFAAGILELGAAALPEPDGKAILHLRPVASGLMAVDVAFDPPPEQGAGVPRQLVIDTGFSGSVHLHGAAADALIGEEAPRSAGGSATAHRRRDVQRTPLEGDLLLGEFRVVRPVASVFAGDDAGRSSAVGTALLRRFTLTLDLPRRRVRLEAAEQVLQPEVAAGLKESEAGPDEPGQ